MTKTNYVQKFTVLKLLSHYTTRVYSSFELLAVFGFTGELPIFVI